MSRLEGPRVRCECSESGCTAVINFSGIIIIANAEQLFDTLPKKVKEEIGPHCDCIVLRRDDDRTEVYMVELKGVERTTQKRVEEILRDLPAKMRGCSKLVEKA